MRTVRLHKSERCVMFVSVFHCALMFWSVLLVIVCHCILNCYIASHCIYILYNIVHCTVICILLDTGIAYCTVNIVSHCILLLLLLLYARFAGQFISFVDWSHLSCC